VHALKTYVGVEVQVHLFSVSAVGGRGQSVLCASRFNPGRNNTFPFAEEPGYVTEPVLFPSGIQAMFLVGLDRSLVTALHEYTLLSEHIIYLDISNSRHAVDCSELCNKHNSL
jgi:hypothetical protein